MESKKNDEYFFIDNCGIVLNLEETYSNEDDNNYNLGNYFKTDEEAQKVIDSKEWKEFWAKVRAGEI